jgi:hypothetical protein
MLAPAQLPVKQNRLRPDKPNNLYERVGSDIKSCPYCRLSFASARCFGEEP